MPAGMATGARRLPGAWVAWAAGCLLAAGGCDAGAVVTAAAGPELGTAFTGAGAPAFVGAVAGAGARGAAAAAIGAGRVPGVPGAATDGDRPCFNPGAGAWARGGGAAR